MNVFLDTSALVKLDHKEIGTERLAGFLSQYSNDLVITISDITPIEFHSAFLKRVRMEEIKLERVKEVFSEFEKDQIFMNIVELIAPIKEYALSLIDEIAATNNIRTLDAIQLSTAIVADQFVPLDYFVTSDQKLLAIAGEYFKIFNPAMEKKTDEEPESSNSQSTP